MDTSRLKSLMEQIQSGKLSRNRDYDAFADPLVRQARDRHKRILALTELLHEGRPVQVRLTRDRDHNRLSCRFPQLDLAWVAYLLDFELDLLLADQEIRQILTPDRQLA